MAENVKDAARTYYTIGDGKLSRMFREGDDESKAFETRQGNKKVAVGNVTGFLSDVYTSEGEFGKQLCLVLSDEDAEVVVAMPSKSESAKVFLKRIGVIDLDKEILIGAFFGESYKHDKYGIITPTYMALKQRDEFDKWSPVADPYKEVAEKPSLAELGESAQPFIAKIKDHTAPVELKTSEEFYEEPETVSVEEEDDDLPF